MGDKLEAIKRAIERLVDELIRKQAPDGSWRFCFESGVMTDAYYLLLLEALGIRDRKAPEIIERIMSKQTQDGTWKLFADEKEGNVTATLEACMALFYARAQDPSSPRMKKAREFLQSHGGMEEAGTLSRVVATLLGHGHWSEFMKLPVEFFLLPLWSPIHFFDFVGYTRVHLAPIMITADRNFTIRLSSYKEIDDWLPRGRRSRWEQVGPDHFWTKEEWWSSVQTLFPSRKEMHARALRIGEQFLKRRIEPDGTLYSYLSSTFLMVFALLALGKPANHHLIRRAVRGISRFAFPLSEGIHMQETTSTVWDTSLILHALQRAGLSHLHPTVKQGLSYLLSRQHDRWGDWRLRNPDAMPGGWGFSDINTINPDVDDTAACLRALAPSVWRGKHANEWKRGITWLLSMQNNDGGWPAFEKNTNKKWQKLLPYRDGRSVWGDPSTADLTGRVLEFLGNHAGMTIDCPEIRRAWSWLFHHQRADGSWFGRWGISFIYGTWAALTGMAAVKVPRDQISIQKGVKWLLSIQREDGGWGESCNSDRKRKYVPLPFSTLVQTAWALDALIAVSDRPTPAIEKGVDCLLNLLEDSGDSRTYPVGAGLAGQFYVHYHSYPYIWPLVTLAHYVEKYGRA